MLKIDGLKVSYGGIEAVKGITFEVPERKIVTLIGANGAGKSTTLRTIAGLVKPAKGRIHLQGEDITGLSPDRIVAKGVTLVPEAVTFSRTSRSSKTSRSAPTCARTTSLRTSTGSTSSSRGSRSAPGRPPVRSRAANSRCLPSAARS